MKKLFLLLFSFILLSGCATIMGEKKPMKEYKSTVTQEKPDNLAYVSLKTTYSNSSFGFNGVEGFTLKVVNSTTTVLRVVWEKSSISYNGNSFPIFIDGQKYSQASSPMPPSVIPSSGVLNKEIFSSEQPELTSGRYGGWSMNNIKSDVFDVVLFIEAGDKSNYYTIHVEEIKKSAPVNKAS